MRPLLVAVALAWAAVVHAAEPTPLVVLAAASLTESFGEIAHAFEAGTPGVRVQASFAASSTLAAQIEQGAPADVVATADEPTMARLRDAGALAAPPVVFARNRLAIVVERGNPKRIATLADLGRPDVALVLAAEQVPVGRYARQCLAAAGVTATPRSLEADVKAVVAKVALGEADAGIAYETDLRAAAGKVDRVAIPDAANVVAAYPVAPVARAAAPDAARRFVDFLRSADARAILARHGFAPP